MSVIELLIKIFKPKKGNKCFMCKGSGYIPDETIIGVRCCALCDGKGNLKNNVRINIK